MTAIALQSSAWISESCSWTACPGASEVSCGRDARDSAPEAAFRPDDGDEPAERRVELAIAIVPPYQALWLGPRRYYQYRRGPLFTSWVSALSSVSRISSKGRRLPP